MLTISFEQLKELININEMKFLKAYSIGDNLFVSEYETKEYGKIIHTQLLINGYCMTDNWVV